MFAAAAKTRAPIDSIRMRTSRSESSVLSSQFSVLTFDRALNLLDELGLQRFDRPGRVAAGRILVSAAATLFRDGADVDLALRSHADAVRLSFDVLEEDDGLDLLDGKRQIDQPFGVIVSAPGRTRHFVIEIDDGDAPRRIDLHAAQHRAEELEATH